MLKNERKKMIKNIFNVKCWLCFWIIFLSGFSQNSVAIENAYLRVSIYQLIVTPERYLDQKVEVDGYFGGIGFDLYPTRLHAENLSYADTIALVYPNVEYNKRLEFSPCMNKHVSLQAKFAKLRGMYGLVNIKTVRISKNSKLCWKPHVE